ncbi:MAG: hypothetical protein SOZ51_10095, partial [Eubacteriales bacterium]|nr:hypothetical protein [Eubacteriales bacterium]
CRVFPLFAAVLTVSRYFPFSARGLRLFNQRFLGGKLARQRLMRGDKSPLSSFDISTPVNPAPLLLIGAFFTASFLQKDLTNR